MFTCINGWRRLPIALTDDNRFVTYVFCRGKGRQRIVMVTLRRLRARHLQRMQRGRKRRKRKRRGQNWRRLSLMRRGQSLRRSWRSLRQRWLWLQLNIRIVLKGVLCNNQLRMLSYTKYFERGRNVKAFYIESVKHLFRRQTEILQWHDVTNANVCPSRCKRWICCLQPERLKKKTV